MSVWDEIDRPISCLAPMEGVTDAVFRQVVAKAGRPDLFFTEFTNVSSYASERGRENALERLRVAKTDEPIIAQVWGKNPEHFSETVAALGELGFSGVDLNFGCPDRHVNAAGGGAAMIRTPELAVKCLRRAKEASGGLPVSVKTRLGFTFVDEFSGWLRTILEERPAALTVHLRTRKEMSKVPAHFELIPEIVRLRDEVAGEVKLIINGDILDISQGEKLVRENPGVDGFMVGRGVFYNPFCFRKTESGEVYRAGREELFELLEMHLGLFEREGVGSFEALKHYFKIYVNNFPGAGEMRARLMEAHAVDEARAVMEEYTRGREGRI